MLHVPPHVAAATVDLLESPPDGEAPTAAPAPGLLDRTLLGLITLLARRDIASVAGLEHIQPRHDPFILVANHASRRESVFLPALLAVHRGGDRVHLLGDWNYRLIPGVNFLYRRGGIITVARKPARPAILNRLRPLYADPLGALRRARLTLDAGRSVALFPEGTVNRDPSRLLVGLRGAAWLSLRTGAPVVPAGITFTGAGDPLLRRRLQITIGPPIAPAGRPDAIRLRELREWHAAIMGEIARLSQKRWSPDISQAVQHA